ncbi:MAG: gliding motility-associated C-terminal domain-containing protein [Patiriisocius sp.]|uniref:T9SS type B sorting domain-containing protein n=1 Tax=Patiriisocius sp. TaxID=2822396 RepID=UPI003EF67E4E
MEKITHLKFYISLLSIFLLLLQSTTNAQVVIGAPSLQFTQACANESFNSYTINFVYSPENGLGSDNTFIVEMSNENGDFETPTVVYTSQPGAINASPVIIDFSIPTNTSGENYKIRIKSTEPQGQSANSQSFPAYYKIQDSPFTINGLNDTAFYCQGGGYLLTIDNPGENGNVSPLNYPWLTYKWYKVITPTTSTLVGQSPSLLVEQEGTYFVETNYGSCTSNSFSNRVTVVPASNGEPVIATITSSLGNPFCAENGMTQLSTIEGNSHIWYRDGTIIPGANASTYLTDVSGEYSVRVDFGNCEAFGSINLETGDFFSELDIPVNNTMELGETLQVSVTTSAINPVFQWILNDETIDGAIGSSFDATQFGNYRVLIIQSEGCSLIQELNFKIEEFVNLFPEVENIPNIVSPNGDSINDTWIIPTQYVSGTNTRVTIFSNRGEIVFETNDYENNWPIDQLGSVGTNQIFYYVIVPQGNEPKKGSITILK